MNMLSAKLSNTQNYNMAVVSEEPLQTPKYLQFLRSYEREQLCGKF